MAEPTREVGMRRNVWIANDSGYMTFRNPKAFFETTVEKYKRKSTLWIDRYGYYEDSDLNHLKALYIEVEKLIQNGGIRQVRLRALDKKELDFWLGLGFKEELRTTDAEGAETAIMLKNLHKPYFGLLRRIKHTLGF